MSISNKGSLFLRLEMFRSAQHDMVLIPKVYRVMQHSVILTPAPRVIERNFYFFADSRPASFLSIWGSAATRSFAIGGIGNWGRAGSGQSRWKNCPRGASVRS